MVLSAFLEKKIPPRPEDGSTQPEERVGRAWASPEASVVEEVRKSFALGIDMH